MSETPSGRPKARVHSTCDGSFIFGDRRAPVDRDGPVGRESIGAPTEREGGPVMRRVIGAAPVSRPAKTQEITELYSRGELTDTELDRVMTVAVPAFAIGCLVGMLLL